MAVQRRGPSYWAAELKKAFGEYAPLHSVSGFTERLTQAVINGTVGEKALKAVRKELTAIWQQQTVDRHRSDFISGYVTVLDALTDAIAKQTPAKKLAPA